MYLILEQETIVAEDGVIGIFDLDNISWSFLSREYISAAEKSGRLKNVAEGLPKTLIVADGNDYVSQWATARIMARRMNALSEDF
jgi:hypothetical protein